MGGRGGPVQAQIKRRGDQGHAVAVRGQGADAQGIERSIGAGLAQEPELRVDQRRAIVERAGGGGSEPGGQVGAAVGGTKVEVAHHRRVEQGKGARVVQGGEVAGIAGAEGEVDGKGLVHVGKTIGAGGDVAAIGERTAADGEVIRRKAADIGAGAAIERETEIGAGRVADHRGRGSEGEHAHLGDGLRQRHLAATGDVGTADRDAALGDIGRGIVVADGDAVERKVGGHAVVGAGGAHREIEALVRASEQGTGDVVGGTGAGGIRGENVEFLRDGDKVVRAGHHQAGLGATTGIAGGDGDLAGVVVAHGNGRLAVDVEVQRHGGGKGVVGPAATDHRRHGPGGGVDIAGAEGHRHPAAVAEGRHAPLGGVVLAHRAHHDLRRDLATGLRGGHVEDEAAVEEFQRTTGIAGAAVGTHRGAGRHGIGSGGVQRHHAGRGTAQLEGGAAVLDGLRIAAHPAGGAQGDIHRAGVEGGTVRVGAGQHGDVFRLAGERSAVMLDEQMIESTGDTRVGERHIVLDLGAGAYHVVDTHLIDTAIGGVTGHAAHQISGAVVAEIEGIELADDSRGIA